MSLFSFPSQVNERAARLVAATVAVALGAALVLRAWWVVPLVAAGFLLRVGWGPSVSPLARAAMAVARRFWAPKPVSGAPKRFAQAIGAACTLGATGLFLAGQPTPAWALVGTVVLFATLEATVPFCAGCWIYRRLQGLGVVPADACVDCGAIAAQASGSQTGP